MLSWSHKNEDDLTLIQYWNYLGRKEVHFFILMKLMN